MSDEQSSYGPMDDPRLRDLSPPRVRLLPQGRPRGRMDLGPITDEPAARLLIDRLSTSSRPAPLSPVVEGDRPTREEEDGDDI